MATMPPEMFLPMYKSVPTLLELLKHAALPPLPPLLAHVGPNGNFNVPVVFECPPPRVEMETELVEVTEKVGGATAVVRIVGGKSTAITVTGSGTWGEPFVLSMATPDILAITRDVARSG
jgi:hypothetical protein